MKINLDGVDYDLYDHELQDFILNNEDLTDVKRLFFKLLNKTRKLSDKLEQINSLSDIDK